ncbi:hypothetical protein [Corynebacterium sp.]|uniref:hypothetical protein n=1 Tax=Corynebacterium sp. TaxID=1720 RepID=UPI003B3AA3BB
MTASERQRSATDTDMTVLLRPGCRDALVGDIREVLSGRGAIRTEVGLTAIASACEPDNMLIAEYQQRFEAPPVSEQVHRLTVHAYWSGATPATAGITRDIAACLPRLGDGSPGLWFGQTTTLRSCE